MVDVDDGDDDDDGGPGSGGGGGGEAAGASEATPAEMSADDGTAEQRQTGAGTAARTPGEGEGPPSFLEARRLFELGILADPTHGPLYNAYG